MRERLIRELRWDVVVEDGSRARVRETLRLPARVREHLLRGFAGHRDHRCDKDDQSRADLLRDDRRDVPAERLRDHDDVGPGPDGIDDDVRVLGQPRTVVLDREVGRDGLMAATPQVRLHQVPVPADVAGAVDERECCRHRPARGGCCDHYPSHLGWVRLNQFPESSRNSASMP